MTDYSTRPAQFRFPKWAHEFLVQEAAVTGKSKTEIVVEALDMYRHKSLDMQLADGYTEWADALREEAAAWDGTLSDGLGREKW